MVGGPAELEREVVNREPIYLGTRRCPHCRVLRHMEYHEDEEAIRCAVCGNEVVGRAGKLTFLDRYNLIRRAEAYEQRTGIKLRERRDVGLREVQ